MSTRTGLPWEDWELAVLFSCVGKGALITIYKASILLKRTEASCKVKTNRTIRKFDMSYKDSNKEKLVSDLREWVLAESNKLYTANISEYVKAKLSGKDVLVNTTAAGSEAPVVQAPLDLSKCKAGQKLKLRNGEIVTFVEYTVDPYPAVIQDSDSLTGTRTRDGLAYKNPKDIVEILQENSDKVSKSESLTSFTPGDTFVLKDGASFIFVEPVLDIPEELAGRKRLIGYKCVSVEKPHNEVVLSYPLSNCSLRIATKKINLRNCILLQKIVFSDGSIGEIIKIDYEDTDLPVYIKVLDTGECVRRGYDGTPNLKGLRRGDVIATLPVDLNKTVIKTYSPKLDLSTCKVGQKLRLRDGSIVVFETYLSSLYYSVRCRTDKGDRISFPRSGGHLGVNPSRKDVVEILPMDEPVQEFKHGDKIFHRPSDRFSWDTGTFICLDLSGKPVIQKESGVIYRPGEVVKEIPKNLYVKKLIDVVTELSNRGYVPEGALYFNIPQSVGNLFPMAWLNYCDSLYDKSVMYNLPDWVLEAR